MRDVAEQIGGRRLTPMLRQYVEAKESCPRDSILLFRMGDFYELFFDDARIAARELELTLTSRDKDTADPIPMAGVPHHAVTGYIGRLVEKGFTVAICDQVEDPKLAKGIVKREVTRLVTPGTVSDLEALDPGSASYLALVAPVARDGGLDECVVALFDLLAGEVLCTRCRAHAVVDELTRMGAREVLLSGPHCHWLQEPLTRARIAIRRLDDSEQRDPSDAEVDQLLESRFGSAEIEGAQGGGSTAERRAVLALLQYAERTQRRKLRHCLRPRGYRISDFLVLDEATRRNLELVRTQIDGRRQGSLLWHLDRCRTAIGSRLLAQWLLFPLRDKDDIETRLDTVAALRDARPLREELRRMLDDVRDIERLMGRVAVGRATPRDLGALRGSLAAAPGLRDGLSEHDSPLGSKWRYADVAPDVLDLLSRALVEEPPISTTEGGIFARGFRDDLDELISMSTEGHDYLADLERRERERTGISNLKVRFNRVFGYYIEVTRANLTHVPDDYIRKQTLVSAERFITDELKTYETRVLGADEKRRTREHVLFGELVEQLAGHANRLRALSRLIAETDAAISLAQVAEEGRYTRPVLCDEPVLQLKDSRHPVVERLMPGGERFVPNDVDLDARDRQLLIVTGPNMAGKSTAMRQVALCTVMAHMGSFVPVKAARIGLCDRVFTRVGASDNLGRGQSTFMVEMIETATILSEATDRSLVILDEIGRGTSTFDGVSIAWAVAEHLHDRVGCRGMFATHYHELTDLAVERPRIVNVAVSVEEVDGSIAFLRRLVDGAANRSYGIQVASLAGLPETVLTRAREILGNLESGELDDQGMPRMARGHRRKSVAQDQLPLFVAPSRTPSQLADALAGLDPLNMTPIEALQALDRLKKIAADEGNHD